MRNEKIIEVKDIVKKNLIMKMDKFINHPVLQLPKNWVDLKYKSYYECVIQEGTNYLKLLQELDDNEHYGIIDRIGYLTKNDLITIASHFYQMVFRTLQCYLNNGNPHKAYEILNQLLYNTKDMPCQKPLLYYLKLDVLGP